MSVERLEIWRRRLPHWRQPGSAYFVTWRIKPDSRLLTPQERSLIADCIRFYNKQRYELYAWVVMDDHAHAVVRPFESFHLDKIVHTWKSYTANQMQRLHGRTGSVWITESFDRIIRNEDDLFAKCEYVINNPLKRWPDAFDYQWSGWD